MDDDQGLIARIQEILFQAEMEILAELINHYKDLTNKFQKNINKLMVSMDGFTETNQRVRDTYYYTKKELNLLEDKMKHLQI